MHYLEKEKGKVGRTMENIADHIGSTGALLHRLEEEARGCPVILFNKTAVSEHRRQVVAEYCLVEGQQVPPLGGLRKLEGLLFLTAWK